MKRLAMTAVLCAIPATAGIVHTLSAPDARIIGLGYGQGSLWMVDGVSEYVYRVDPSNGAVLHSWYCENHTKVPTGLTFAGGNVYIVMVFPPNGTSPYAYRYSTSGVCLSAFSMDC